jgi:hypothetical protein
MKKKPMFLERILARNIGKNEKNLIKILYLFLYFIRWLHEPDIRIFFRDNKILFKKFSMIIKIFFFLFENFFRTD